jgi:hypothetical protein
MYERLAGEVNRARRAKKAGALAYHFFFPDCGAPTTAGAAAKREVAAAGFAFSCFGFFFSRFPRC